LARPSRRIAVIALAFVVVTIVVAALVLNVQSSGSANANRHTDSRVTVLLAGIPQEGRTLGYHLAPVTLQLFGDLEDVDTRRWVVEFLPAIVNEFVRPDILKIEYRSFKTNTLDPKTFVKQQTAAVAAGAQNRLWNYVETFYYEQRREYTPYATENYLDGIARQTPGLNVALWHRDRNDGRRTERVVADDQQGRADGIHTTPAYRLGRTGDKPTNIAGSAATVFRGQVYSTSWLSAEDLARAIRKIH
jgi:hypothetical protein